MMKFEVLRRTADRGLPKVSTVAVWLDAAEIFTIQADPDPAWAKKWSVLTFKPSAGQRSLTVAGAAEEVAAAITAERDRQRQPLRRARA